jgi:hypothetical protein
MNYFFQLLNIHGINEIRQREIHAAEPLIHEPSFLRLKLLLKRYKLPFIDQIVAELIQAEGNTLCSEIHKLITSVWNKEE